MLLFWRKGITENLSIKARDQSLGRVFPLKQGGEPSVYTPPPLQCGPCIIAWTMEEIPSKPLLVACDGRTAAFSPTLNDYSSRFFFFTGFCGAVLSFYESNPGLCIVEGPSQQIKTKSINMLPLGNWRPTNLYLKGICVICKAASVYIRVIHCSDRCRGL